jgi:replication-associated recombination protein RarA
MIRILDIGHVKQILLFGRPGTAKTQAALQIKKMQNAAVPKVVNCDWAENRQQMYQPVRSEGQRAVEERTEGPTGEE